MADLMDQVLDILDRWEMFQGQRAGRELWVDKPREVQDQDIESFCKGLSDVRRLLSRLDRAAGAFCPGWLASQTDMLADDWYIVQ